MCFKLFIYLWFSLATVLCKKNCSDSWAISKLLVNANLHITSWHKFKTSCTKTNCIMIYYISKLLSISLWVITNKAIGDARLYPFIITHNDVHKWFENSSRTFMNCSRRLVNCSQRFMNLVESFLQSTVAFVFWYKTIQNGLASSSWV